MTQPRSQFCFPSVHPASLVLTVQQLSQGQGMDGLQSASNRTVIPNGGLRLSFCVCPRNLQELNPPEREKTELQFASWGPQGNQLVSKALYYLPHKFVLICIS